MRSTEPRTQSSFLRKLFLNSGQKLYRRSYRRILLLSNFGWFLYIVSNTFQLQGLPQILKSGIYRKAQQFSEALFCMPNLIQNKFCFTISLIFVLFLLLFLWKNFLFRAKIGLFPGILIIMESIESERKISGNLGSNLLET